MKKGIKKIAIILALALIFVRLPAGASFLSSKQDITFLVCGVDDAAENTDVLCIVNYNKVTGGFNVYQIPRDTYIDGGRINGIYPSLLARGYSDSAALKELCQIISSTFSVNIDGYVGITTQTFQQFVSNMGGIYVTLDEDITLKDNDNELTLLRGENLLGPKEALYFIRYRTGYIRGDLQRMEMQRIFMKGLYDTAVNRLTYRMLVKVAVNSKGVITNISPVSLATIVTKKKSHTAPGVSAQTLPGEALLAENGAWYYVISRRPCIDVLSASFKIKESDFDHDRRLVGDRESFKKIYYGSP